VEPEWRRELSDRLHAYRVRRHGGVGVDLQSALPFEAESGSGIEGADTLPSYAPLAPGVRSPLRRRPRTERVEISIPRHEMAYPAAEVHRPAGAQPAFGAAPDSLFPVAALGQRRRAAMLDGGLLLFSYEECWRCSGRWEAASGSINSMPWSLLPRWYCFYAQYFALFTVFGGCTPGMMLCRLRVLSFDGRMPTSRQMIWRSFGYLVSAGTCMLGFLWALWDEDHLCWQDRISRTYLTPVEDLATGEPSATGALESGSSR